MKGFEVPGHKWPGNVFWMSIYKAEMSIYVVTISELVVYCIKKIIYN
jgi:hypothetical protein